VLWLGRQPPRPRWPLAASTRKQEGGWTGNAWQLVFSTLPKKGKTWRESVETRCHPLPLSCLLPPSPWAVAAIPQAKVTRLAAEAACGKELGLQGSAALNRLCRRPSGSVTNAVTQFATEIPQHKRGNTWRNQQRTATTIRPFPRLAILRQNAALDDYRPCCEDLFFRPLEYIRLLRGVLTLRSGWKANGAVVSQSPHRRSASE
jgi:hypothetical protein